MTRIFSWLIARRGTCGVAACLVLLLAFRDAAAAARSDETAALVSITGLRLGKNDFVRSISLKIRSLRLVAVCHLPAGWSLAVGNPQGATGSIEAGAGPGASVVGHGDLRELHALLLVRRTFAATVEITGSIDIETRGDQLGAIQRPLAPSNIVAKPADRCPPLRAWAEPAD